MSIDQAPDFGPAQPPCWDVYCHVVDNLGDIGVCWRLARALAARGCAVRLVVDDASALAWMAPGGCPGVTVLPWSAPPPPGDVVIEAFGCELPTSVVQAMAARPRAPVWINLEYLSAEAYVERSHTLPSPQPGGLVKWFFYPGFTPRTGGLLQDDDGGAWRAGFDREAWLAAHDLPPRPGERVVTLFCYDDSEIAPLLALLAAQPTLLLLTPGAAQRQVRQVPPRVRTAALPWLPQPAFDRLLASADLNFVRGEDSLVRALWAGAPFVWQAYRQADAAHLRKLEALMARFTDPPLPPEVQHLWRRWNGAPGATWPALPALQPWRQAVQALRARLLGQADLATQLLAFAATKAPEQP